jgi:hypothetical protein
MQRKVAHRLDELKALQARVQEELAQLEPRRQYLMQELLKLQGAVQAFEGLLAADVEERACDADGVVLE